MNDIEVFKFSVEKVTADMIEIVRDLKDQKILKVIIKSWTLKKDCSCQFQ